MGILNKWLSYEEKDGMIRIVTDFEDMPEFVYPSDKFKDFKAMEKEMEKKAKEVKDKKAKKDKVLKELEKDIKKKIKDDEPVYPDT